MSDFYPDRTPGLTDCARRVTAVTPNDSVDLTDIAPCLLVGSGGDCSVIMAGDDTDTPITIPLVLGYNPVAVKRIRSTGTVASNIWQLFPV